MEDEGAVGGEVVTAEDNSSSNTNKQESCTVGSDVGVGNQDNTLLSSCDQFWKTVCVSVSAPVVTNVTVDGDSTASVSAPIQSKVQESILTDSTHVPGVCQQAAPVPVSVSGSTATSLLPSSYNTIMSGKTMVSGSTAVSENNAVWGNATFLRSPNTSSPQTMTVHEYCQAFEQSMWQYYWWMQHVQWMTWAAYMSTPMYTAASCIPSTVTQSVAQAAAAGAMPAVRPAAFQQQLPQQQQMQQPRGREGRIPSLSRRVTAEFIDFLLVFSVKLVMSIVAVEYGFDLFQTVPAADVETLLTMTWDPNLALSITSELVVMEVINRIFICIFESVCLSLVGATPGKRMLGIRVVACNELVDLPGNRIRILPAGNITLANAVVRSAIKNFSLAFFFPVCLTVFFFTHNRTGYDIISSSIVVELPEDDIWAPRPLR